MFICVQSFIASCRDQSRQRSSPQSSSAPSSENCLLWRALASAWRPISMGNRGMRRWKQGMKQGMRIPKRSHTHLLRNVLSNYWCGLHRTCKDNSVKPNRSGLMTVPNVYIYIYIYSDIPAAHDGAQGLSLQCPATAPTEGVAVQGHCMQVRLHGSRGGVFVGHRPPRWPPAKLEVLHLFRWHTHTRPTAAGQMKWKWKWDDNENEMNIT